MALCAGKSRPGRAGRTLERLAIPNRTRQRLIVGRPLWLHASGLPIFPGKRCACPTIPGAAPSFQWRLLHEGPAFAGPSWLKYAVLPLWQVRDETERVERGRTSVVRVVCVDVFREVKRQR